MAERIGLSDEAYGRIERGRVLPRVETLARIAEETGASLDELLLRRPHPGGAGGNKREALLRGIQGRLRTASERELELLQAVAEAVGRWRSGQRKRGTT